MSTEDNAPTPDQFAGQPDAWQRLWTPHRMVYIGGENKPRDTTTQQCPFCRIPSGQDEDGLVVYRGPRVRRP